MRDFEQESAHREITDENIDDELKIIDNVSFVMMQDKLLYE